MTKKTCYMCDRPKTSKEHAPPKSLFPELETFGRDVRRNLITVPSCDAHNSGKKKDDEFFKAALVMMCNRATAAGEHQFREKVLKGAQEAPSAHRNFFREPQFLKDGTPAMRLDRDRFDNCVDHLTRALYFHTFGQKWFHTAVVASPSFYTVGDEGSPSVPDTISAAVAFTSQFLGDTKACGENPEVFEYGIRQDGEILGFAACFYGCVEIYVASSPTLSKDLEKLKGKSVPLS